MNVPDDIQRWALVVEYEGSQFQGFQRQVSAKVTVQGVLEKALSRVANHDVTLICCGRTDAGVHATQQVVHFDTHAVRPEKAWVEGVNTQLPKLVRVVSACSVPMSFHARFSALSRTYRYVLYTARSHSALMASTTTWVPSKLDVSAMQAGANHLLGEHDFSSFRASQCQARSPVRHIEQIKFYQHHPFTVMEVRANAFLYHMVRNIMGSLLLVGQGRRADSWVGDLLALRDRTQAAPTAPANGLYFVGVDYDPKFQIQSTPSGPPCVAVFMGEG